MIVNVIEIFTEYLSVILYVHKIAKKKLIFDRYIVMFFILDLISVLVTHKYREECGWFMWLVYANFFAYIKLRLNEKWTDALKVFGIMFILIPSMQLLIYYFIKWLIYIFEIEQNNNVIGIEANCLICVLMLWEKKQYISNFVRRVIKSSGMIVILIIGIFFTYLLYVYKKSVLVQHIMTSQILMGIIGVETVLILWINAENEKESKAKELQLYELYNKTFEEAIVAIRTRQHEFDNHINAIKCLRLTSDNPYELARTQEEYCDKIMQENSFNRILKMHMEPILAGFLYSKFTNAKEQGIRVVHDVHAIEVKNRVDISSLVEVIGVLLDNATEALLNEKDVEKVLVVKILQEDKTSFSIEVANRSRKFMNSEIEKFCECGYSTKGINRGMGLSRVKEIVRKNKADFFIGNICYDSENYLSFKIIFDMRR